MRLTNTTSISVFQINQAFGHPPYHHDYQATWIKLANTNMACLMIAK